MSVTFTAQVYDATTRRIVWSSGEGVNINQRDGGAILRLLGYVTALDDPDAPRDSLLGDDDPAVTGTEPDWCNSATPDDFAARILLARAMLDMATDDADGRPTTDLTEPGHCRWIEFGREPGTLARRLDALDGEVAAARTRYDALITWG